MAKVTLLNILWGKGLFSTFTSLLNRELRLEDWNKIFSMLSSECTSTSNILAGQPDSRLHSAKRFSENVLGLGQTSDFS